MIPTIINLGPIPVHSFGLMVALSLVAGVVLLGKSFKIRGLPSQLAERYVFVAGLSGLLGARIFYVVQNWHQFAAEPLTAIFSGAGFTFYGGFIFAAAVIVFMARRDGLPLHQVTDSYGPTLALCYLIGRLGCQLSGDGDYGAATSSILGMSYETGVAPTPPGVLVWPTPFFESLLTAAILFVLLKVETSSSWNKPYSKFGLYLVLISIERFFIEFIRIEPRVWQNLTAAQIIAICLIFLGLLFIWRPYQQKGTT